MSPTSFFCTWISSVPFYFDEKTILSPIEWFWHPCQKLFDQIRRGVYFWAPYSILLVYMPVLMPVAYCCFLFLFLFLTFLAPFPKHMNELMFLPPPF